MIPIKRSESLKALSREHHHGLLLCWKIKAGLKKQIDTKRIKAYTDWFWKAHLKPHFEVEEKYIFPILGNDNHLVKTALAEHQSLKKLFESAALNNKKLTLIDTELENHIRFEERILFNEIQSVATDEQLQQIQTHHTEEKFADNLTDVFWE